MIDSLATVMSDFPGEANRSRCLAHIVNLVVKIILRQFDVSKKKGKNIPNNPDLARDAPDLEREADGGTNDDDEFTGGDVDEVARVLDKEEKEMDEGDEGDDLETEKVVRQVEMLEEAMEGEIKEVLKTARPVRQVLYKVCAIF